MDAPLQVGALRNTSRMWTALYQVHPKLTWSQKQVENTLLLVEPIATQNWPKALSPEERSSWVVSIARQFRVMARHINNGKSRRASWVPDIIGSSFLKITDFAKPPTTDDFLFGYDPECKAAYRYKASSSGNGGRDYTNKFENPPNCTCLLYTSPSPRD
eukprot:1641046-Alexandrium_andersonii.AAC.1